VLFQNSFFADRASAEHTRK